MKRLGALLPLGLILTACGGSGADTYSDAASVAKAAGFSNCAPDTEVISSDAVDCDEGRVNWFKSAKAQDSWNQVAAAVGDLGGPILSGSRWAVECDSVSSCNAAKAKLGGKVS